jgi:hypothetical protein
MRTQRRNKQYHKCWNALVGQLVAAFLFVLLAGCNDTDSSDKDTKEDEDYWKDKRYELDWDLPAGGNSLRFKGMFFECTIGELQGDCRIMGTIPVVDGDIVIDTRDTLISITQDVPSKPQAILSRTADLQLKGTMIVSETTCDLIINLHIEFDVNIEKDTGTLKYPATGITGATMTCKGISVPWPVPFSSLLTGDEALTQVGLPFCPN